MHYLSSQKKKEHKALLRTLPEIMPRLLPSPASSLAYPQPLSCPKMHQLLNSRPEVILYNKEEISREELATKIATERALVMIPPYDHPDVIAGQGTAAKELFEESGPLDVLLVCCGGGGLLSGCAIAARALAPTCQTIGVEPDLADDATRSFHSGMLQRVDNPDTIADGARTPSLGNYTFPIVMKYVDDMITVSEDDIRNAMHFMWERMKLVIEPTGALAAAALLTHTERFYGQRVGVVLSGGNVDIRNLDRFF